MLVTATDEYLPEQIGLAMPLQSPYTGLVNKEWVPLLFFCIE